ncbi:MAG TPA: SpoIIE family protein phosphatase, partial [Calditrichia bacterium]|nr:SpoIIE family protein phosphatase [Calditrichia bacterium]
MFKNVSKEEIIVPATMAHLKEVRDFIEHIGKKYRFSDKVINSFKLVVDEACTNIIRHGYLDIKDGKITVRAIIRRLSLTIAIIDQGRSFDPRQMKNPDLEKYVQIGKKGGLGIFMMRKLMDDIQYNLTSKGNELRLTKVREALQEPAWRAWWEGQSIRRRYFLLSFGMITLLTLLAMAYSLSGVDKGVRRDVFAESAAISRNFAETSWQPLQDGDDLILNENTKFLYESRPDLIKLGLIVDSADVVVAAWPDLNMVAEFQQFDITRQELVDTLGGVSIYQTTERDSQYFYFAAPVILKTVGGDPAGKVILKVSDAHIKSLINSQWLEIFATIVIGFLILIGLTGLLVTFITRPFHSLADWVRQVGRGQVDEDEIDIDSNDEIGEIAQAFNEMTGKFREAQLTLIEQQRLQKELQVAQEIQQMLLPDDFPDVVGYDIASYYQSAKEVGGDLFDFMEVDDHSIGICVADVSGKGIPGSLVMTMIRTSLRLETRGNKNPAEILTKVNGFVTDDIRKGMFVTMLYVILDSRERMVSFASAGHNPMILYRGKSTETFYLNPSGFPVGITLPDIALFGERIQADRIRLHPDDILILYTDGITEAMNPKRELYGEARFLAAIRKFGSMDVTEFVKAVKADILEFTQGYEQNDDITLVAIKENMAAVDVKVENFRELFDKTKGEKDKTIAEYC